MATNKRALAKVARVQVAGRSSSKAIEEVIEAGLVARIFRDLRPTERGKKDTPNSEYSKPYCTFLFADNRKARHLTSQQIIEIHNLMPDGMPESILDLHDAVVGRINDLLDDWRHNLATWYAQRDETSEAKAEPQEQDAPTEEEQQTLAAAIASNGKKRQLASVTD